MRSETLEKNDKFETGLQLFSSSESRDDVLSRGRMTALLKKCGTTPDSRETLIISVRISVMTGSVTNYTSGTGIQQTLRHFHLRNHFPDHLGIHRLERF